MEENNEYVTSPLDSGNIHIVTSVHVVLVVV